VLFDAFSDLSAPISGAPEPLHRRSGENPSLWRKP